MEGDCRGNNPPKKDRVGELLSEQYKTLISVLIACSNIDDHLSVPLLCPAY